jgi:hypothetical protein
MWCRLSFLLALAFAAAAVPSAAAPAGPPVLHFSLFTLTDLPVGDVAWSGHEFLYTAENTGPIEASDATGKTFRQVMNLDQGGEEMRCVGAPAAPKYWPDGIYCHTPDNRILRIATDGSSITLLARLPATGNSDGTIAFDTVGRFGYALLATTGGSASSGGRLFAIRTNGTMKAIGSYAGPGGADNIVIAPAHFGSASGWALLAIDQDSVSGRLVAMGPTGKVKELAADLGTKTKTGINPVAVISASPATRAPSLPAPGLYIADTLTKAVYLTPASGLKSYVGGVIVGTEKTAQFWVVRPTAAGAFRTVPLATDLPGQTWNLEGAEYVP